ncbi:MAG TPA: transposase [Opitutaceae bacterium]
MRRKTYDDSFREGALAYLERSQGTFRGVAARLGIPKDTLYLWYRSHMATKAKKIPSARKRKEAGRPESDADKLARLEEENRKLRRQIETLEEDKVILKKFAAFSTREKT